MKLKSINFLIFVLHFFSLTAQNLINNNSFELSGYVTGDRVDKKVYISYNIDGIVVLDSVNITNGSLIIIGNINNPSLAAISNNRDFEFDGINTTNIYIVPGKMYTQFNINDLGTLKLYGSYTQNEYVLLEKSKWESTNKLDSINQVLGSYYKAVDSAGDVMTKNIIQEKIYDLEKVKQEIINIEIQIEFKFIKKNVSSFVSLDMLSFRLNRKEGVLLYDTIAALFKNLSKEVKNSFNGKQLQLTLTNQKNSSLGSTAPNFIVKDINDHIIPLSSFRNNKYLLLDFWASWCSPCRDDNPVLKEIYSEYQSKGLEIIGLSRDTDSALWKKAILKDDIQIWKHSLIQQRWSEGKESISCSIMDAYFVRAIPVKILINKEGIIIGRWRGGGQENMDSLKKKLSEIFKGVEP